MIIERRDLLKWGMVAPAIAAGATSLTTAAMAKNPGALGLDALVLDTRLGEQGIGAQELSTQAGLPIHRFKGDVTTLWTDLLDQQWRKKGFVLGGITGRDALFVLEHLAWDRGRRVAFRRELSIHGQDGFPAISWIIAPHHPSMKG